MHRVDDTQPAIECKFGMSTFMVETGSSTTVPSVMIRPVPLSARRR